jgi:hypothetical protein
VMLRREGFLVNHKRLFRLYCEERLKVRRHGGRQRAMGTRRPIETLLAPNQRWSLDFVSDQLTDGRWLRVLTVVNDCKRELDALIRERFDVQRPSSATTALNSHRMPSCNGRTGRASIGTISHQESLGRTVSSRASTLACAMNFSTRRCSGVNKRPHGSPTYHGESDTRRADRRRDPTLIHTPDRNDRPRNARRDRHGVGARRREDSPFRSPPTCDRFTVGRCRREIFA